MSLRGLKAFTSRITTLSTAFVIAASTLSGALPFLLTQTASAAAWTDHIVSTTPSEGDPVGGNIVLKVDYDNTDTNYHSGPFTISKTTLHAKFMIDGTLVDTVYGYNTTQTGTSASGGSGIVYTLPYDTTTLGDGSHTMDVEVYMSSTSVPTPFTRDTATVNFTVDNSANSAPIISTTTPVDGKTIYKTVGTYKISADVTDPDGDLSTVTWKLAGPAGNKSSGSTTPAFTNTGGDTWSGTYNLSSLPAGVYTLTFNATDNADNNATPVVVNNIALHEAAPKIVKVDPYYNISGSGASDWKGIQTDVTVDHDPSDVTKVKVKIEQGSNTVTLNSDGTPAWTGQTTTALAMTGGSHTNSHWLQTGTFTDTSPTKVTAYITNSDGSTDTMNVNLISTNRHHDWNDVKPAVTPIIMSVTPSEGNFIHGAHQRIDINISNPSAMKSGYLMLNKAKTSGHPTNGTKVNYPLQNDGHGNWYAIVDTTNTGKLAGDGEYLFKVEAHGASTPWGYYGNNSGWYSSSYHFTVDNAKPSVSITKPTDSQTVPGAFTVNGTANDGQTHITKVLYTVNEIDSIGGHWKANGPSAKADGTNNWNFDVSGLSDGFYRVKVQAFDAAGNWKYTHNDIRVDNTTSDITVNTFPFNGVKDKVFGGDVTVHGTTTPSGASIKKVWLKLNQKSTNSNVNGTIQINSTTSPWSHEYKNLPSGKYRVMVTTELSSGLTLHTGWSNYFIVDSQLPTISSPSLSKHLLSKNAPSPDPILSANVVDKGPAGIKDIKYFVYAKESRTDGKLRLTGPALLKGNLIPLTTTGGDVSATVTGASALADGNYLIRIVAHDKVGNGKTSPYLQFTVDNTAPVVSISNPTTNQPVSGTVDIEGSVTDNYKLKNYYLTVIDLSDNSVVYTKNYNTTSNVVSGQLASWDTSGLNGNFQIVIEARDAAGNKEGGRNPLPTTTPGVSIDYVDVNVDNTAPTVSAVLSNVASGDVVNSINGNPFVTITATDSGSGPDSVQYSIRSGDNATQLRGYETTVNGISTEITNISGLHGGSYILRARGFDQAGNKKTKVDVPFTIDRTAPNIPTITSGVGDNKNTTRTITGTADLDAARVTVAVAGNSRTVPVTSGAWSAIFAGLAPGDYSVTAFASDAAGNNSASGITPFTVVATLTGTQLAKVPGTPQGDGPQVQGLNTDQPATGNPVNDGVNTDTILNNAANGGQVQGDETTVPSGNAEPDPAANTTSDNGAFLGLGWWWLLVLAVLAGAFWLFAGRKANKD